MAAETLDPELIRLQSQSGKSYPEKACQESDTRCPILATIHTQNP